MRSTLLAACLALLVAPACIAAGTRSGAGEVTCLKDTSYEIPGALTLTRPGLTWLIDPIHTFRVYGDTVVQIRAQMSRCAPNSNDGFPGYTRDWVNYHYQSTVLSDGFCRVVSVEVGVHSGTVIPAWTPGPNAAQGLAGKWRSYITALARHEHGHSELALEWGRQLLSDLQNLPELACSTVAARTAATFTSDNNALGRADVDYDARTHHGATQGAVF